MFHVWNIEGVQKPYEPGGLQAGRPFEPVQAPRASGVVGSKEREGGQGQAAVVTEQYRRAASATGIEGARLVAREVMRPVRVMLSPDLLASEAMDLVASHEGSFFPVAREERLVGLLSITDLLRVLAASKADAAHVVRDLLAQEVLAVHPNTDIVPIVRTLIQEGLEAAPVVDEPPEVVGVLEREDALRALFLLNHGAS